MDALIGVLIRRTENGSLDWRMRRSSVSEDNFVFSTSTTESTITVRSSSLSATLEIANKNGEVVEKVDSLGAVTSTTQIPAQLAILVRLLRAKYVRIDQLLDRVIEELERGS
ncbi:hypothetical protein [Asanoa hainanensis]|uniref:hypothetical protein n=1 Tax=Asanoa hainanensis TaxID=560556 RepID=UPI00117D955D|nr:hypothetical protein [Asanoa hainanensis]